MYDIQLNESGTRHMNVSEEQMLTIKKHNLLNGLANSTGFVTENELDKLKLNLRALIASGTCEDTKELLDLCIDVVYHDKMKAFGLKNLIEAYRQWETSEASIQEEGVGSESD